MSSDRGFVDFILDQVRDPGRVSARAMFGEYALYCDGKVVGLICDDRLFIKPTPGGKAFLAGELAEGYPYPGAKPWLLVEDRIEDRDWLTELLRITAREAPAPKPKPSKAGETGKTIKAAPRKRRPG